MIQEEIIIFGYILKNKSLTGNKWDTHNINKYCDNNRYCHTFIDNNVKEYQCLGHKENEDILLAILVKDKAPCLPFYLQCIYNQNYDKKNLHLYIRTNDNNDNSDRIIIRIYR